MNIEERLALNKQKLAGNVARINAIDAEREVLLQEALRIDGENRILLEQLGEKKTLMPPPPPAPAPETDTGDKKKKGAPK